MKVIAVNGSPRKNWNTSKMLKSALEGAASQGAETELINLYDYNYKGCISCFACKLKDGKSYGKCAVKDELKPILDKIEEADALIVGSPIYFGQVTGETRSFLERLLFQYLVYDNKHSVLIRKKIPTAMIYTMNVPEEFLTNIGYEANFNSMEQTMKRIFGTSETLLATDTYQFQDYSKYETSGINEVEKAIRHRDVFPEECKKAFDMGCRLVK